MKSLLVVTLIFCFLKFGACQDPSLSCWVGYGFNTTLRGGSVPCDGGTCINVNGNYAGVDVNLFACEPKGICSAGDTVNLTSTLTLHCCQDANNCNAKNFTIPDQPTPTPALPNPIVCYEGLYINANPIFQPVARMCYGNCASFTGSLNTTNITITTCDPLSLCDSLDLVNSCHVFPQQILSGCCCNSNLCIDPANNILPTPPTPPAGTIKCFIGIQYNNDTPIGSESYCPGMCHSTRANVGNNSYTTYACDRYQICEMFGVRPNSCGSEEGALRSCCCNSDNCNTPGNFIPPAIDPNPPLQAERCFTGFATTNLGPLGRSAECFGDCVTYSAGDLKIYGCDPISVCEQLNAKNTTSTFHDLSVSCCSTRDCNYNQTRAALSCYNGVMLSSTEHGLTYNKAQSLPCMGRCATFSTVFRHLSVNVYTCDPYNFCSTNPNDLVQVNCCDTPNCNKNTDIPLTTVAPTGRNSSCFEGFQLRRGTAFGNRMSCDGTCARVHIGEDTIYTCDPGDTCSDFGLDGCHMLFDGLTICCCRGRDCNAPEQRIPPAIKSNLNCFVGFGIGDAVSGGQLPCDGMCGQLKTNINGANITAYLCLDQLLCEERDSYERCGSVLTDRAVRACCCGGYDHCNYEPSNGTVLPPPPSSNNVSCPQGLYVNGVNVYHTGNKITSCPYDCGLLQFNTTYNQRVTAFSYYGCDPASFCNQYSLSNTCGALGSSVGGCCCNSDLCMNPSLGKLTPTLPDAPSLNCWVGYNYNGNLRGGSVKCDGGTCLHLNGTYASNLVDVFACEPYGLCANLNNATSGINLPGLVATCCQDSNNCNAKGYTMPTQPTPTPALPNPIVCNEGLYMNGAPLSFSNISQKLCYGNCASISANVGTYNFTVATCDPVTLCNSLNLTNACHTLPQGVLSGCCCNSNLCIDPVNNIMPTPTSPGSGLSCWVGYNVNNTLRGGSVPCDGGTCLHLIGTYANNSVDVFACEPYGLCANLNNATSGINLPGLTATCCQDSDNCNANGYTMPTQPTPTPALPNPIVCYEGLYMNNAPLSFSKNIPKQCYGNCASISANIGSYNFTVATCDPVTLCDNLNLTNSCHTFPQGVLSGCCCNSNLCIDPTNGIIPSSNALNCFVGYNFNSTLRGGSVPCDGGTCMHLIGTYANTSVDVFACEPYGLCANLNNATSGINLPGLVATCCQGSDNCNANGYTLPVQPTPTAALPDPIVCYEGLYMNGKAISSKVSQKLCYGNCATVSAALGNNIVTVATCDPVSVCSSLNLTNSCHTLPQQVLSGCCCDSDRCTDPTTVGLSTLMPTGTTGTTTPKPSSAVAHTISAMLFLTAVFFFY